MSIPKLCARLAVFLCTLILGLFVTRLFLIPPQVEVRVAAPTPPTVVAAPESAKVNFKVQQVVLDRAHRKTYVQLIAERDLHMPAPEYLGVSLVLYTQPNISPGFGSQGCGVEAVYQPFAQGDRATPTVEFPCPYSGSEVTDNIYAQVRVTTQTTNSADAQLRHFFKFNDSDIRKAIPVVVEHKQKH